MFFIGAIIACYFINRLYHRLLRYHLPRGTTAIFTAGLLTIATTTIIGGWGFAPSGSAPVFVHAFMEYVIPAALVVGYELFLLSRPVTSAGPDSTAQT